MTAETQPTAQDNAHRSRWPMIIIIVVSVGSLGGSWLLFFLTQSGSIDFGTVNNGAFVEPARTVSSLALSREGVVFDTDRKWWLLVVPGAGRCDSDCSDAIERSRALHVLLNREAGRVRRGLVVPSARPVIDPADADVLIGPGANALAEGAYIVDPDGNFVTFYRFDQIDKPLLEDLKRLLKVSQLG